MGINPSEVIVWPPTYSLKKHPRAKHIRFRASLRRGLELIVPSHFNVKRIPALLDQNRIWIEKQLVELQAQCQPVWDILPDELEFQAINTCWKIQYLSSDIRLRLFSRSQQELVLVGKIEDKLACRKKLIRWVKEFAKTHLQALLEQVSQETGLSYQKVTIRDQLTRWGSCSKAGSISLNYKLIFLPYALARHTIIHELCHTVHLNHSDKFWRLVSTHDSNAELNRYAIRKAGSFIPKWLP